MNGAELTVHCLENEGVKYIFGVPGEENEDFLFALEDSSITFIPVRHEQGGAFMANVWGRLSGTAGVCLSTLGPGATNLLTGVADANLDKSPLIAITGQGNLTRLHHESHQIIDVVKMMQPVTKWNKSINSTTVIPEIVRKAFKTAESEKPGASHIELPEDIAGEKLEEQLLPLEKINVRRPAPDYKSVKQAKRLLKEAKKPLIIAGNGGIRTRASKALTAFVNELNIPVAFTFMGKGAVSAEIDQAVGTIGLGFKDYIFEAVEEADLILCIGYDIAEYDPTNWNHAKNKAIVHIDFEPAEVHSHYVPKVEIIGDISESITNLCTDFERKKYANWYVDIKQNIQNSIQSYSQNDEDLIFNTPGVINTVREILPHDGLLISDVGSHKMWIARNYETYCPNGCIISNGLASMGISLPGGIAAKLVDKDRPVVSIMGDGGALMNIQELETAKRLNVGCTFIILNDNNYGLITWKQKMSEGHAFGTALGNPDFPKLADSFGIKGYKPKSVGNLKEILNHTLTSNELSVIEIPITTEVNQELTDELQEYFKNK